MRKIILFILAISLPSAAFAECAFDFNGENDCGEEYQSIYEDEQVQSGIACAPKLQILPAAPNGFPTHREMAETTRLSILQVPPDKFPALAIRL
jgi:hypothetical protein